MKDVKRDGSEEEEGSDRVRGGGGGGRIGGVQAGNQASGHACCRIDDRCCVCVLLSGIAHRCRRPGK